MIENARRGLQVQPEVAQLSDAETLRNVGRPLVAQPTGCEKLTLSPIWRWATLAGAGEGGTKREGRG